MVQPNATSHPAPPPGLMEYLAVLVQNGSLSLPMSQPLVPLAPSVPAVDIPPSTEGRSFTRPGRGQGGAFVEK